MVSSLQLRRRGLANRGQSESTRIRLLKQCIIQTNINRAGSAPIIDCPVLHQPLVQDQTTPDQLSYLLAKTVNCPILFVTPITIYDCQQEYTVPIPAFPGGEVQGPAVAAVLRKFSRISGIDQISKPLATIASSDRTARIRAAIESETDTRFIQTDIPIVPYPACLPPSPQPGVPIAPISGCNPGTRRVDFSNPNA